MIIRHGKESDIDECVVMSKNFHEVSGYKTVIPFCQDSVKATFDLIFDGWGVLSVAETENELIGFIGGLITPSLMNKSILTGAELAWWVEPAYRKGKTGISLLKHIEQSAKAAGCVLWSMMCLDAQSPEKMRKLYKSLGYKEAENTYTKKLEN